MKNFQVIILIIFIFFAIGGVFLFATFRGSDSISNIEITIWGEERQPLFDSFLREFDKQTENSFSIKYVEIKTENFSDEVVEAIAGDNGPDIVILPAEEILRLQDKIFVVPYESISERDFRDAFIEGGEIFLSSEGVVALPFIVDPLVMYWNRDILQSNGLASPPKFWNEFFSFADKVTEKDEALNITKSAVAMGEFSNIKNAKEIILTLIIQNGNPVVKRDRETGRISSTLSELNDRPIPPVESALRFYTEFANPTKTSYSWNRALPNSQDAFVASDLAIYFGFASELSQIRSKNPNLNFDVARFPQASETDSKKTFGKFQALAVIKRSKNITASIIITRALVGDDSIQAWSDLKNLPPVKRSLLSTRPGDAYKALFYDSALISKAFLDPDTEKTNEIFKNLVERIVSGRERVSQAVRRANVELSALLVDI